VALSEDEKRVDAMLALFCEGARFRRNAIRLLREYGLTFAQWRVLRTTQRVEKELRDAVSQQAVGQRAGIDDGTVSTAMDELYRRGLVDVSFDALGWSHRIIVTGKGEQIVAATESRFARLCRMGS